MLGHMIVKTLSKEFDLWVTTRRPFSELKKYGIFSRQNHLDRVDCDDLESVSAAIFKCRPNIVVNCVGLVKQSPIGSSPVHAITANALFPHQLADICTRFKAKLIHVSTDCVFSGDKGMYAEDDHPDATDVYGRSKALGEVTGDGHLTLRTSIIGPELGTRQGLMEWFLNSKGPVNGYEHAKFSGVTTLEAAKVLAMLVRDYPGLTGLYHLASEPISKHQLLTLFNEVFDTKKEILPTPFPVIDRTLDPTMFKTATRYTAPSWRAMIEEVAMTSGTQLRKENYELAR